MIDLSFEDVVCVGRYRVVDIGEFFFIIRVILDKMDIGLEMLGSIECKGIKFFMEVFCLLVSL